MPELPFPDDVRALLTKPNPAVVSTLSSSAKSMVASSSTSDTAAGSGVTPAR